LHFDNAMPERRFPPPWSVEELNDACFVVKIAYVYFEDELGRRSAAKLVGLSRRTLTIDHLLYEINSGFWR
jgi:hypothetical protein